MEDDDTGGWGEREVGLFYAHKHLVREALAHYPRQDRDLYHDMYSYALIGLWHAIDGFNSGMGASFQSWARLKIKYAIQDGLRELDLISRDNRERIKQLTKIHNELAQKLGADPTWAQLRESGADVTRAVQASWFANQDLPPLDHWLDDFTVPGPETIVLERDIETRMTQHIARLPARLSVVIELLYYSEYSQTEVGEILGVSGSRISQLHKQAVRLLRDAVKDEFVDD